jgi:hypothetical protein
MKAIKINNKIEKFSRLPKTWEDANGLHLNIGDGSALGFKDLITPEFDSRIEELGAIIESGDAYTFEVVSRKFEETIAELKAKRISELKQMVNSLLSQTDWYITRESETGESIPQEIRDERAQFRSLCNAIESDINSLTTKKSIASFDINI